MKNTKNFIDTKPHYELLDGLRGFGGIKLCENLFYDYFCVESIGF